MYGLPENEYVDIDHVVPIFKDGSVDYGCSPHIIKPMAVSLFVVVALYCLLQAAFTKARKL